MKLEKKTTATLLIVMFILSAMGVMAHAVELTDVTATATDYEAGATADYTIVFTIAEPSDWVITTIDMEFPAGFVISSVGLETKSGIGDGAIIVSGQVVTFEVTIPVKALGGAVISFVLTDIINTDTSGDEYFVTVTTKDPAAPDGVIDGPTDSGLFTIVPHHVTVSLTVTVEAFVPFVSISVDPTSIGFGSVVQGEFSVPQTVTITSASTVSIDLDASVNEDGSFYADNLLLDGSDLPVWDNTIFEGGDPLPVQLVLEVPIDAPTGLQAGTLVFWAVASE